MGGAAATLRKEQRARLLWGNLPPVKMSTPSSQLRADGQQTGRMPCAARVVG